MRQYQPHVVVTYDENGFYGHPDHIQANRITLAAIAECGIPEKLYYTAVPRSSLATMGKVLVPGPEVKLEITRSSHDRVNASSQPERMAGKMIGKVMTKNTLSGRAPRSMAASSSEVSKVA